ncbi:hypothetical protein QYE76_067258 [Lolium multiflorum]|uniref:Uncharacterized protein n=1 Tax=Lolium multiflorum TaxID=4521 RepID=A0AAD8SDZ3_LOLMU|nr:hypothetical protein QYE76_067258 [Lolium multiflorum]
MVKKKSVTTAASSTSGGAAAKPPLIPPKGALQALLPQLRQLWRRPKLHPRRDQSAVSPTKTISSTGTKVSSSLHPRKLNLMLRPRSFRSFSSSSSSRGSGFDCFFPLQGKGCSCHHHDSSFCVISSLEAFASQFTSLEADNVRLQEEVKSSSSKLDGAIKKAAMARQEVDSLKEELGKLKERLKEEETRAAEKDELLRQSSLALLAANIPAAALDTVPNNSPANGVSMALASHQLTRELLERERCPGADAFDDFPQAQAGQDSGAVFPVPSFVDDSSGALPEVDRIQRMKDRITQMEKDLRSTYALAAIVNKKSEIAADVERYALTEPAKLPRV